MEHWVNGELCMSLLDFAGWVWMLGVDYTVISSGVFLHSEIPVLWVNHGEFVCIGGLHV